MLMAVHLNLMKIKDKNHLYISTHQQQGETGRDLANIPDNLIRLAIGAEHPKDIIEDLSQALKNA